MISTANYVARKYNVRSAMPGFIAKELCPELVFVPHEGEKYKQAANDSREIFAQYDPLFQAMSLDEAYLDLSKYWDMNQHLAKYEGRVENVVTGKTTE